MSELNEFAVRCGVTGVAKRKPAAHAALVAAYREGLGLAPVVVIASAGRIRISASGLSDDEAFGTAHLVEARWWCRRAGLAERVAAAADARLRRHRSGHGASRGPTSATPPPQEGASAALVLAYQAIASAARQYDVVLQSEEELVEEAASVIARIDEEMEKMQRSGQLKSVNKSYQQYRVEASARGECVQPYQDWMNAYRQKLIRQLAVTLRHL